MDTVLVGNNENNFVEGDVQTHLRQIIQDYLKDHPKLTLNGLSQRCAVSEPTLRRICKGQIKTQPSPTTVLDILSYFCKSNKINIVADSYPGPATEFLKQKMSQVPEVENPTYSEELNEHLQDPINYIIYKLAANSSGVKEEKLINLFGNYGVSKIEELLVKGLIKRKGDSCFAENTNFILSHDLFNNHFKAMADFIKPHKLANSTRAYSPLFANYSSSVNKHAYASIVRIQRQALKQVIKIMMDKDSQGDIPTFALTAVDTLDHKSAQELI